VRLRNRRRTATFQDVERAEYEFYVGYVQPGMTVFDVGANVGELTLLFSRLCGDAGTVHAFEPGPVADRLERVCTVAGPTNIIVNRLAVGDRSTTVALRIYDEEHHSWNTLADRPVRPGGVDVTPIATVDVRAVTLDDYCAERDVHRVDLLKIDVEGSEYQVLRGSERLLSEQRVGCCVFEYGGTTEDMGVDPVAIEQLLSAHRYELRNVVGRDPIFPTDPESGAALFSMHVAWPRGRSMRRLRRGAP
jgi:FkbM family methyltransferase